MERYRRFALTALPILAACGSTAYVSSPTDKLGQDPSGEILPIATYLSDGSGKTIVFFLHGVNDHCPGYGIDPTYGWLNEQTQRKLGLKVVQTPKAKERKSYSEIVLPDAGFSDAELSDESKITVRAQDYAYVGQGPMPRLQVVEITWSELTQWLKRKQIGNDLQNPEQTTIELRKDPRLWCLKDIDSLYRRPPRRSLVNRYLKEHTLDRSLVDAIIYSGAYGRRIQNGLAEALCAILDPSWTVPKPPDYTWMPDVRCDWSKVEINEHSKYIFVTHSLGGRILYDTLLGLMKTQVRPEIEIFSKEYTDRSDPVVSKIARQTSIIYMMANQLPLLGLSNVENDYDPTKDPRPMRLRLEATGTVTDEEIERLKLLRDATDNLRKRYPEVLINENVDMQDTDSGATLEPKRLLAKECTNVPPTNIFAAKRAADDPNLPPLKIVAFSDTDDLLSWPIPPWYMEKQKCAPKLDIVNVYVQNATRWFGLFSNPGTAHGGYFQNNQVWELMRCGGKGAKLERC